MENFCIYTEIGAIVKTWTELGGWKGFVSYGLGADISLPPCQVGGRLVSETAAHSISDPRAEILGILVTVRRSSSTSRGTIYWFQYFLLSCFSGISFAHAQFFRTEVHTTNKKINEATILIWGPIIRLRVESWEYAGCEVRGLCSLQKKKNNWNE